MTCTNPRLYWSCDAAFCDDSNLTASGVLPNGMNEIEHNGGASGTLLAEQTAARRRPAEATQKPGHALQLLGVSMTYGDHLVLDRIDLDIPAGEFLTIIGPSGCGKSTVIRLLAGLARPTSGALLAWDKPILGPSRERAIVFQDYSRSLLPWRTVWANVALAYEGQGIPREERRSRAHALLDRMGLGRVAEHFPAQLSGGMQQ